jgi:orsellinic acid C2-O-methyltransferase
MNSEDIIPATTPDLSAQIVRMVTASWMSQAIYVAAELRLADLLAGTAMTSEELASATGTHAPSLRRLLRALTTIDICKERQDGSFELTPLGALLRGDSSESLRSWALYFGGYLWPMWGRLLDSIKTGESARALVTGHKMFEHLEQDPKVAAIFNQAMVELTRKIAQGVVSSYDFSNALRVVDVGGGNGELLAAILTATPGTQGVLFDMPHALESGQLHMTSVGLAERCEWVTGNFFESIPSHGDVYLLKNILHDWNDEQCQVILRNCRQRMTEDEKLLIIERVIPERFEPSTAHQSLARSDLNMLIGPGGRERTEDEFHAMLASAGFHLNRLIAINHLHFIIEAIPV